jgi:sec-independent protein translocase protein TatA
MFAPVVGFISMPGGPEWIVIGIVGLLIFGKRLPEVARSLGKSVVEFKKGLKAVEDEITGSGHETSPSISSTPTSSPSELPPTTNPYSAEATAEAPPKEAH